MHSLANTYPRTCSRHTLKTDWSVAAHITELVQGFLCWFICRHPSLELWISLVCKWSDRFHACQLLRVLYTHSRNLFRKIIAENIGLYFRRLTAALLICSTMLLTFVTKKNVYFHGVIFCKQYISMSLMNCVIRKKYWYFSPLASPSYMSWT